MNLGERHRTKSPNNRNQRDRGHLVPTNSRRSYRNPVVTLGILLLRDEGGWTVTVVKGPFGDFNCHSTVATGGSQLPALARRRGDEFQRSEDGHPFVVWPLGLASFRLGIEKSARYDATLVQSWTKTRRAMWSEVTLGNIFRCERSDF